jgi:hypothetical protein
MKRLTYILFMIVFGITLSCNTKKLITTTDTKKETTETTETNIIKDSLQKGLTIESTDTKSNLIEESVIRFDSVSSITINPDRSVTATGRNLRIIQKRSDAVETSQRVHIDTTKVQNTQETALEEKKEIIDTTQVQKDIKRKVSFVFVQFGLIILILLALAYWGLKKYFT